MPGRWAGGVKGRVPRGGPEGFGAGGASGLTLVSSGIGSSLTGVLRSAATLTSTRPSPITLIAGPAGGGVTALSTSATPSAKPETCTSRSAPVISPQPLRAWP